MNATGDSSRQAHAGDASAAQGGQTEDGKEHFHCLDSLRFICAMAVALFHVGWVSHAKFSPFVRNCWVLVDFFFVLSGFVIANAYVTRMHGPRPVAIFAVRRFFRLYPLHLVALAAVGALQYAGWALGATANPFRAQTGYVLFLNLILSQGIGLTDRAILNVPSWSISTEWYAYLTFAAVCLVVSRPGTRFMLLGVIALGGLVATRFFFPEVGLDLPASSALPRCLMSFGLGTLTFAAYRAITTRRPSTGEAANSAPGWIAAIGLVLAFILMSSVPTHSLMLFAAPPLFAAIILALSLDRGSPLRRALERRWLVYLGERSYSIYLNHVAVLIVVNFLVSRLPSMKAAKTMDAPALRTLLVGDVALVAFVAVLVPVSIATYRWIELPGIAWGRHAARAMRSQGSARTTPMASTAVEAPPN